MKRTGYISHSKFLEHDTGSHPENTGRLQAIEHRLETSGMLKKLNPVAPRPATEDEIALIHDRAYIRDVKRSCAEGITSLDADTVISEGSYEAAVLAAGAGLKAVDLVVDGKLTNAFLAVRPPGHHAEKNRAMGFCLFNNIAIAARYAQVKRGLSRTFIFDWDVHHGNGTQHAFYSDGSIYYASTHQYPFYPGTGASGETGVGDGLGANLNFPLDAFSGDGVYLDLVENRLLPEMYRFKPELILISAGFDAHEDDPLANMNVSTEGFARMTALIKKAAGELCQGRLISMLEGGYNHEALADSVLAHLETLAAGAA